MSSNSKFLFDTEFGTASIPSKKTETEPEAPPLLYTEEDKQALCLEAQQAGFAEGQAQALNGVEAAITQVLENMNQQLQQLSQQHTGQLENMRCEAASMAYAIADKLAPALISLHPEKEVMKMIENCLIDLHDEPRIVVRASEPVCNALSERVETLTQATGFQGNVILLPDDTKQNADCRVEWADGGVEKNLDDTREKISEIVDRFVRSGGNTN
ncbi:FliH/SctL family protein [Sneathiella aquimaris]|uniref:FliH/SctL family protein n=1 Tax=Sneathiella aquimaris TaxID=2599305 RepID=UPI00146DF61E|nr:FliH/SctL family protein [Sneathiella aquimaris]